MDSRDVVGHIFVALESRRDGLTRADLYDRLRSSGVRMCFDTIAKYLGQLQEEGIVSQHRDPHDARRFLYHLAADAEDRLERQHHLSREDHGRHRKVQTLYRVLETVLSAPDVLFSEEEPKQPQQKIKVVRR